MSESTTERRPVGGLLLGPLAVRDFDLVSECFEPAAKMRALLPRGLVELTGAPQIVAVPPAPDATGRRRLARH